MALWRFAIAGFCFVGTYEAWSKPQFWVYFTFQTGFVLGIVMLWSGAATLLKGIQPPAWLKGCLTVYAIVTALVAFFLTPPDDPAYVPQVIGIMTNTMLHKIAPIMAVIDFVSAGITCSRGWRTSLHTWSSCWPVRRFGRGPDRRPAAVRIRTASSTSTHSAGKGSALAAASWP